MIHDLCFFYYSRLHVSALPSPPTQPLRVLLPCFFIPPFFDFQIQKPNLGVCKFPAQLILSRHRAILTPGYTKLCNSFRFHTNVSSFRLIFICCVSRKNPPSLASNCFSSNLIFAFQFCNLTTILHFHSLVYRGCHLCHLCWLKKLTSLGKVLCIFSSL